MQRALIRTVEPLPIRDQDGVPRWQNEVQNEVPWFPYERYEPATYEPYQAAPSGFDASRFSDRSGGLNDLYFLYPLENVKKHI